jgi:hypothetical protein
VDLPPRSLGAEFYRETMSDFVKPVADRLTPAHGGGLAGQDEEGRLENVFNVLSVRQGPSADAQHQGRMTPHQGGEGFFVTLPGEAVQQLAVGEIVAVHRTGDAAEVVEDSMQFVAAHDLCTPKKVSLTLSCRDAGTVCHFF